MLILFVSVAVGDVGFAILLLLSMLFFAVVVTVTLNVLPHSPALNFKSIFSKMTIL